MTTRDRLVLMGVAILVVLAGGWILIVQPERKKASQLASQVSSAREEVSSARGKLTQAKEDQTLYTQAYASIVSMGKSVPAAKEVPSLVYELEQASNGKQVEFASISTTGNSASSSATPAASTGFAQLPFTFTFNGSFVDLSRLLARLENFTVTEPSGGLLVDGRLLTIQSVDLTPSSTGTGSGTSAKAQLSGTIEATAYVLPAGEGLTAGATASSPTGASTASTTGSSSPGAAATPALIEVKP